METGFGLLCFAVFLFSLLITFISEKKLISVLSGKANQPIYTDGPAWHSKKSGTPTMGGLAFLPTSLVCLVFSFAFSHFDPIKNNFYLSIIISLLFAISNSLVGVIDDYAKLKNKQNKGLSPFQKLFFQLMIAIIFLMARAHFLGDNTIISFAFGDVNFGFLYYLFAIIILLGIVNCANLTDGIDGLASSVALTVAVAFFLLSSRASLDTQILSLVLSAVSLAFLFFNMNPAQIFMGDTGSLFLGAMAVSCAFSLKNPFLIIFIGGVYVLEGISVILQVLVYKATGKRIFKMAPIHHHLEKIGFSENKICLIAVILSLSLSLFAKFI